MIGYLEGTVLHRDEDELLLLVDGVGYELTVTAHVLAQAEPKTPLEVFVHTHQPQGMPPTLFGFSSAQEKTLFRRLIDVNSVGPKVAIKLLSLPLDTLVNAIAGKDVAVLTTVKGLGKKTAEKICLDLAEKVLALATGTPGVAAAPSPAKTDASAVLQQLGFTPVEINRALAELDGSLSAEDLVTQALRQLGR